MLECQGECRYRTSMKGKLISKATNISSYRSAKGDLRHEEIRQGAIRIFAQRGYHGASMQDLADALGLHKANLYYYYRSKEDLLFDILSYADTCITALLEAQAADGPEPLELLERYVAAHVTWYLRHPDVATVSFRDWNALTGDRLAQHIERRRNYSLILRKHLQYCQSLGLIDAQLDVIVAANFINGAVAAATNWYNPAGPQDPDTIGRIFGGMALASAVRFKASDRIGMN